MLPVLFAFITELKQPSSSSQWYYIPGTLWESEPLMKCPPPFSEIICSRMTQLFDLLHLDLRTEIVKAATEQVSLSS